MCQKQTLRNFGYKRLCVFQNSFGSDAQGNKQQAANEFKKKYMNQHPDWIFVMPHSLVITISDKTETMAASQGWVCVVVTEERARNKTRAHCNKPVKTSTLLIKQNRVKRWCLVKSCKKQYFHNATATLSLKSFVTQQPILLLRNSQYFH